MYSPGTGRGATRGGSGPRGTSSVQVAVRGAPEGLLVSHGRVLASAHGAPRPCGLRRKGDPGHGGAGPRLPGGGEGLEGRGATHRDRAALHGGLVRTHVQRLCLRQGGGDSEDRRRGHCDCRRGPALLCDPRGIPPGVPRNRRHRPGGRRGHTGRADQGAAAWGGDVPHQRAFLPPRRGNLAHGGPAVDRRPGHPPLPGLSPCGAELGEVPLHHDGGPEEEVSDSRGLPGVPVSVHLLQPVDALERGMEDQVSPEDGRGDGVPQPPVWRGVSVVHRRQLQLPGAGGRAVAGAPPPGLHGRRDLVLPGPDRRHRPEPGVGGQAAGRGQQLDPGWGGEPGARGAEGIPQGHAG